MGFINELWHQGGRAATGTDENRGASWSPSRHRHNKSRGSRLGREPAFPPTPVDKQRCFYATRRPCQLADLREGHEFLRQRKVSRTMMIALAVGNHGSSGIGAAAALSADN